MRVEKISEENASRISKHGQCKSGEWMYGSFTDLQLVSQYCCNMFTAHILKQASPSFIALTMTVAESIASIELFI